MSQWHQSVLGVLLSDNSHELSMLFPAEEDHEKVSEIRHWLNERLIATALLPIIPTALIFPNPLMDNVLVTAVMLHTHW